LFENGGKNMNNLVSELKSIISSMPERINSLSDVEVQPIPSKWSKKEILGHLCDSGNVNHHRFVDILTSNELVTLSGYNQDLLVKDGKTKLTYSTVFEENAAVFDKVKTYAVPGAEQTMDRLEEHLASMS
jgi:hypothetical protein